MPHQLRRIGLTLSLIFLCFPAFALLMKGRVYDQETKQPLAGVRITNAHTQDIYQTDSTGDFSMKVASGQMIVFEKPGYKTERIPINGKDLPYYSIGLHRGGYEIPEIDIKSRNFQSDSIENRETYQWALEHYTLSGIDIIQHPFDALSKRNRQIWAFQKRFQYFEQQKFIDYVFNDELIEKITSLSGNNLSAYKRQYRPRYEQIQAWTTYEFYDYIKQTGWAFKSRLGTSRQNREQF